MPYDLVMQNTVMANKTEFPETAIHSPSARYRVASVGRAIDLLEAFLQPPHQFGVTELSRMTGQTKNQSFRLLQTLADDGLIVMDLDTKRYSLGYRMLEWGVIVQKSSPLVISASPVMDQLAQDTGETIVLTALADSVSAICIDKRESSQVLQISAKIGRRIPLHAGAGSKCLLAHCPPEFVQRFVAQATPFQRFTSKTITDAEALMSELSLIRERGYAISDEDFDEGACSIAAPIWGQEGVVATLSIASPKTRFREEEVNRNRQAVMAAAEQVSNQLRHCF